MTMMVVDRVGCVVAAVFPGSDISARFLVFKEVFRWHCQYQILNHFAEKGQMCLFSLLLE